MPATPKIKLTCSLIKQANCGLAAALGFELLSPLYHQVNKVGVPFLADTPVQGVRDPGLPCGSQQNTGRRRHDAARNRSHSGVLGGVEAWAAESVRGEKTTREY